MVPCSWNVRSMNQGKLEVGKQEMTRVNIDILGISEIKWTGMGEFNSDVRYIYYCGQESIRRNGVAIIVNKRVRNAVLGCNFKNDRMMSVRFQGKPFNITVIQSQRSWSWMVLWRPERPFRTNTHITGDWNAKVGSQETPGVQANLALEYRMKQGKG